MLGPAESHRLDQPIAVSLEDLVPQDHVDRHLEAKLDLGFPRFFEQVVDLCQEAGLVWGRALAFDASTVEAHAGLPSLLLAPLVTPADGMESQAMRDLLWRVGFRHKLWSHQGTGDATYGTTENSVAIEDAGCAYGVS